MMPLRFWIPTEFVSTGSLVLWTSGTCAPRPEVRVLGACRRPRQRLRGVIPARGSCAAASAYTPSEGLVQAAPPGDEYAGIAGDAARWDVVKVADQLSSSDQARASEAALELEVLAREVPGDAEFAMSALRIYLVSNYVSRFCAAPGGATQPGPAANNRPARIQAAQSLRIVGGWSQQPLEMVDLSGLRLTSTSFFGSTFSGANLTRGRFRPWLLRRREVRRPWLLDGKVPHAHDQCQLPRVELLGGDFGAADLSGEDLRYSCLAGRTCNMPS